MSFHKKLPTWVQETANQDTDYIQFLSFAKTRLFFGGKQLKPFRDRDFPDELKYRMVVPGDEMSQIINGFRISEIPFTNDYRITTDTNQEYDVKFLYDFDTSTPEIQGDDLICVPVTDERRLQNHGSGPFDKMVVSPLSTTELKDVRAAYGMKEDSNC